MITAPILAGIIKKRSFYITIVSAQNQLNITKEWLTSLGWDGKLSVVVTNSSSIGSNSTSYPALTISATMPVGAKLTLLNVGSIIGMGGAGGNTVRQGNNPGQPGGLGLSVTTPVIISNSGIIAGGGGGGGSGGEWTSGTWGTNGHSPGGGGGGGRSNAIYNSSGGLGEGWGYATGGTGYAGTYYNGGSGGTAPACSGNESWGDPTSGAAGSDSYGAGSAGSGGLIITSPNNAIQGGSGGGGGSWGSAGGRGGNSAHGDAGGSGGAGGAAIAGNGNITWLSTGNRYGSIS